MNGMQATRSTSPAALRLRSARTHAADALRAAQELAAQLGAADASAVLLFCSPSYDLEALGAALERAFSAPTIACTTAGQFGPDGLMAGGITALSVWSDDLTMTPTLLPALSSGQIDVRLPGRTRDQAFGVLLTDGLSRAEEAVAASVYQALGDVALVGGSAADDGAFRETGVYHAGRFHRDAAVLALFETDTLPFAALQARYFRPGARRLVTTLADANQRVVYELNGEPAADAYAESLGISAAQLAVDTCARQPLLLTVGERSYVRSVKAVNADRSLSLLCAIEEGLVLSIGEPEDPLDARQRAFDALPLALDGAPLVLAFDTFLDRRRWEASGHAERVARFLAARGVRGFSGYGSLLGPIHFNQALTGIAIGAAGVASGDER
jgi:hypothetical protein